MIRALDETAMPWQLSLFRRLEERLDDGRYAHNRALCSVARQQGKSTAVVWLAAYRLLYERPEDRWQGIIVSHSLMFSARFFTRVVEIVERLEPARIHKVYRGNQPRVLLDGGRRELLPQAANASAGHGLSLDLAVLDEVWQPKFTSEVVEDGIAPTMIATPNPQLLAISTAGTEESETMLTWRERSLEQIHRSEPSRFLFVEWSSHTDFDPEDETAWADANPALGRTIRYSDLRERLDTMPRSAWLRGHANRWVAAEDPWLRPGLWTMRRRDDLEVPWGTVVMESSPSTREWGIARAAKLDVGGYAVTAETYSSQKDCWARLDEYRLDEECDVFIGAALEWEWPWQPEKPQLTGLREVKVFSATVKRLIEEKEVWHDGHELLAEQLARCQTSTNPENGVEYISTKASPGPIWIARAVVMAVGHAHAPQIAAVPQVRFRRG